MNPQSNVEGAVLGACLADPKCYWRVADILSPEDFASGVHARIYRLIVQQARDGAAYDAVTLADLDPALGQTAISLASDEGWRVSNVRYYAETVISAAVTRRVKAAGQQIARLEGSDALGDAQRIIGSCVPRQTSAVRHIREFLRESVAEMQRRVDAPDVLTGVPTSLQELDDLTCGWQPGDLIVIAARPSVGKTAFALQAAIHAARQAKHTLFVSLEMSGTQLADRVQAHVARVNASGMRRPKLLDESDFGRLFAAATEINDLPLQIDETSALTVDAIIARARQVSSVKQLDLIVIDYLTQIIPPRAANTNEALQIVTRALKGLAREMHVPILLLSQLNRDGEGYRPTMKTLRDSGAIEQDADVIVFLHRPDPKRRDHILLIVEKQRNGELGDIHLHANMPHMRFDVLSDYDSEEMQGYNSSRQTKPMRAVGSDFFSGSVD